MGFLLSIVAILAGSLAASAVVIEKLPNAKDLIKKLRPYEGAIGVAALVMSLAPLFNFAKATKVMSFIPYLSLIACMVACFIIGFLLGYPMLQGLFLDDLSEENRQKAEDFRKKLVPYKVMAGLVAIGTGVVLFLAGLV